MIVLFMLHCSLAYILVLVQYKWPVVLLGFIDVCTHNQDIRYWLQVGY